MIQSNLTKESWHTIGSYLGCSDSVHLLQTCRDARKHLDENFFWQQFILRNMIPTDLLSTIGSIDNSKSIVRCAACALKAKSLRNVVATVSDASTVDRPVESPQNTLTPSLCQETIQQTFSKLPADRRTDMNFLRVGYYCQRQCGCLGGNPCYWSSAPCPSNARCEHITYRLNSRVSFIVGLSVTPYQAYMHENAPVYGPQEVSIQFLRTRESSPMSNACTFSGRLSDEQFKEDVYFQSEFFEVRNVFEAQTFFLPAPMLCTEGAVRVVYRGMHRRQQLGHGTIEEFYMCISHCAILALPVGEFVGELTLVGDSAGKLKISCVPLRVRSGSFSFESQGEVCEEFVNKHLSRGLVRVDEIGEGTSGDRQCIIG